MMLMLGISTIAFSQVSLIPYRSGDEWGYCNPAKEIVIPTTFDMAYPFINGIAFIKAGNTYSLINTKGETQGTYTFLSTTNDEVAINRVYYPFDEDGGVMSFLVGGMIPIARLQGGEFPEVLVDGTGSINPRLSYSQTEGFTMYRRALVRKGTKWGYLASGGREVIPPRYAHAMPFTDVVAGVKNAGKWGAIDTVGKQVVPFAYDTLYGCAEGLCMVKKGSQVQALDYQLKVVFDGAYEGAGRFSEGLCAVTQGGKVGYVDKLGKVVIPCQFTKGGIFREGHAVVLLGQRETAVINATGQVLFKGVAQNILMEGFSEGLSARREGNLWGYVNTANEWVVQPKYMRAEPFSCGLAKVSRKIGDGLVRSFFIDHQGVEYIDD